MGTTEWKSDATTEISAALNKAQLALGPAIKDRTNPAFKSKYADLSACYEAVLPALEVSGLSVAQTVQPYLTGLVGNMAVGIIVKTVLLHKSGQWIASDVPMFPEMGNAQKVGGAITYARRYGLCAMMGVYQDDDDGNAASERDRGSNGNGPERDGEGRNGQSSTPAPPSGSKLDPRTYEQFVVAAAAKAGVSPEKVTSDLVDTLIEDGLVKPALRDDEQKRMAAGRIYMHDQPKVVKIVKMLVGDYLDLAGHRDKAA
jgi:hypothetical protein